MGDRLVSTDASCVHTPTFLVSVMLTLTVGNAQTARALVDDTTTHFDTADFIGMRAAPTHTCLVYIELCRCALVLSYPTTIVSNSTAAFVSRPAFNKRALLYRPRSIA